MAKPLSTRNDAKAHETYKEGAENYRQSASSMCNGAPQGGRVSSLEPRRQSACQFWLQPREVDGTNNEGNALILRAKWFFRGHFRQVVLHIHIAYTKRCRATLSLCNAISIYINFDVCAAAKELLPCCLLCQFAG